MEFNLKEVHRGAGLSSFPPGAGGDPAPLYPKSGHFRGSQPQNFCVLIKGGVGREIGRPGGSSC